MTDKDLNLKFLKRIKGENGVLEITDTKTNFGGLESYDKALSLNKDLFFVGFTPVDNYDQYKGKRTKDDYVKGTTYFRADFDIRANIYKERNEIISNEAIEKSYLHMLHRGLDSDDLLKSYTAIICSGNGLHVYRIGKEIEIDKDTYSAAAGKLFERIKEIFERRLQSTIIPDFACSNISRLMRIPGSVNHKEKYGIKPAPVKILRYREEDSNLVSMLPEIGKIAKVEEKQRATKLSIEMKKSEEGYFISGRENPLYKAINEKINIADLVCEYTGWKLAENGKNFISNRDGGYTGAYIIPEENIVIWKGSPHISGKYPVYSPFSFIQIHYADGDVKKTFEKVLELYPEMKAFDSQFLYNAMTKYGI